MKINMNQNLIGSLSIIKSNESFKVMEIYNNYNMFAKTIICVKYKKIGSFSIFDIDYSEKISTNKTINDIHSHRKYFKT